jgi:hypothetical protein
MRSLKDGAGAPSPAVNAPEERKSREDALKTARVDAGAKMTAGPDAAHSQDFLYGQEGLPE